MGLIEHSVVFLDFLLFTCRDRLPGLAVLNLLLVTCFNVKFCVLGADSLQLCFSLGLVLLLFEIFVKKNTLSST